VALDTTTNTNNSAVLASNIHHLRQLVSFRCKHHRIHQVVQQLTLDCSELQDVDVSDLLVATDDSVEQILKLKNLNDLVLVLTSIFPKL